jgi:hypothetical protein
MTAPHLGPHLAPGLRVVRRGLDQVQVGLYDGRRVLLPRTESVEAAITMLLEHRAPTEDDPASATVVGHLDRHGLVVWEAMKPPRRTVAVLGGLGTAVPDLADLLGPSGVRVTSSVETADVVVVLSEGELDRSRLDPLVRGRTTHLVVRLVDGGAVLGPFVVPGTTPCLRCLDAHLSVRDPDHVVVTARYVRATARPRADGVPDLDPALASLAVSWAARDVVAHLRGREPSTWARTVVLSPTPTHRREEDWTLHPRCGCCW